MNQYVCDECGHAQFINAPCEICGSRSLEIEECAFVPPRVGVSDSAGNKDVHKQERRESTAPPTALADIARGSEGEKQER